MNHLEFAEFESLSLEPTDFDVFWGNLFIYCSLNGLNFFDTNPKRVKKIVDCICEDKLEAYGYSIDQVVEDFENGKSIIEIYKNLKAQNLGDMKNEK